MSTQEPPTDRVSSPAPLGADSPARSVVVSDAGDGAGDGAVGGTEAVSAAEPAAVDGSAVGEPATARPGRWVRDLMAVAGTCAVLLVLVNAFVARPFAVPSESMENTLKPGDRLVVNRLAYAFGGHVQRGDVIVFDGTGSFLPYADELSGPRGLLADLGLLPTGNSVFVKRVIGVGGDRVTCSGADGRVRVNGVPIDESVYLAPGDAPSRVAFDIVVPAGKLWVMGDHRSASRDSRDHLGEPGGGTVPEQKVIGRADWVVFPVGRWTSLDRPSGFSAIEGATGHGQQG
ncbi:signal peptidase I [Kitasatospora sp. NBC_00374]|uniref:signal peptidase I n=1 Tax=Kitasatospora sp. NBC_00374 TaxID=2975964 RepID=UPI0032518CFA